METKRERVVIITFPIGENYGGIIQAFALQSAIDSLGKDALVADFVFNKSSLVRRILSLFLILRANLFRKAGMYYITPQARLDAQQQNTKLFKQKYIKTTASLNMYSDFRKMRELNPDAYVVGSDQVWKPYCRFSWSPCGVFLLAFLKKTDCAKRVAYAVSFAVDRIKLAFWERGRVLRLLKKFDSISVRESSGVDICAQAFGLKAEHVLDPTMLLREADYVKLIDDFTGGTFPGGEKFVFEYILNQTPLKRAVVREVSNFRKDCSLRSILPSGLPSRRGDDLKDCVMPHVEEWLWCLKNAEVVVTDSFHGAVFSIIFHKPFVVLANPARGLARIMSLLEMFGLQSRYLGTSSEDAVKSMLDEDIDWGAVDAKLADWREKSFAFLKAALNRRVS